MIVLILTSGTENNNLQNVFIEYQYFITKMGIKQLLHKAQKIY